MRPCRPGLRRRDKRPEPLAAAAGSLSPSCHESPEFHCSKSSFLRRKRAGGRSACQLARATRPARLRQQVPRESTRIRVNRGSLQRSPRMHLPCLPSARVESGVASFLDLRAGIGMVAWAGVCVLVLVAPFEALQPLVRLPGQSLTIVELVFLAVLSAWLAAALLFRERPPFRTPLTLPWVTVLVTSAIAALAAPADRADGLHMVVVLGLAFGVFLVTVGRVSTPIRLHRVVVSAAVVGVAISILVVLEFLGIGFVLRTLRLFRPG